ncbi:MAG: peptidoglycan-binding domain-containing protein [Candidatus Acidiferrum sp.]|jgi:peptidoglycan hydrolase-like protein with peptidoglycan-binding domain
MSNPHPIPVQAQSKLPVLLLGSKGEDVRQVQATLNAALGKRYKHIPETGVYDQATFDAVLFFQRQFRLKGKDGKVGDETRRALATRVVVISGTISRNFNSGYRPRAASFGVGKLHLDPDLFITDGDTVIPRPLFPSSVSSSGISAGAAAAPAKSHWLFQVQPQQQVNLPPLVFPNPGTGPAPGTISSGVISVGFVYRTAADGPHGEFGLAPQFLFNSRNTATDPKYSLQLQASASFADPWASGRFHSALFLQAVGSVNLSPLSGAFQLTPGAQISVDIIEDRWSLFVQGTLANQWTLPTGQYSLIPGFAIGSTIQWELGRKGK